MCEQCGEHVVGNGYTNHCPKCLWSKHVDVHPGDRASTCGGLMEPTELAYEHGDMRIVHVCTECGHRKPNKVSPDDNLDALL